MSSIRAYDAMIHERQGPAEGLPADITYTAVAIDTEDVVSVQQMAPTRRVSKGAKIVAAEPGDWCKIMIRGGEAFLFVTEGILFNECSTSGGTSPS